MAKRQIELNEQEMRGFRGREAQTSQAVSRNPVFTFRLKGGARGDKIEVSWLDNLGETNSVETAVA